MAERLVAKFGLTKSKGMPTMLAWKLGDFEPNIYGMFCNVGCVFGSEHKGNL